MMREMVISLWGWGFVAAIRERRTRNERDLYDTYSGCDKMMNETTRRGITVLSTLNALAPLTYAIAFAVSREAWYWATFGEQASGTCLVLAGSNPFNGPFNEVVSEIDLDSVGVFDLCVLVLEDC
jgi:hypothetical protein